MKRFDHLMIDIETLGTDNNSVITALAAVPFNLDGETGPCFYEKISLESCMSHGLRMDAKTLLWWLDQKSEALREMLVDAKPLPEVIILFLNYLNQAETSNMSPIAPLDRLKVWCNGAGFDFPILKNAFCLFEDGLPWKFWNEMDLRTLKNIHPIKDSVRMKFDGEKHTALDDCYNQIKLTCRIMNELGIGTPKEVAE